MPTRDENIRSDERGAGVEVGEPEGRADRDAGAALAPVGAVGLPPELGDVLSDELVDGLLAGAASEEEIVGPGGLLSRLTKRLGARAEACSAAPATSRSASPSTVTGTCSGCGSKRPRARSSGCRS